MVSITIQTGTSLLSVREEIGVDGSGVASLFKMLSTLFPEGFSSRPTPIIGHTKHNSRITQGKPTLFFMNITFPPHFYIINKFKYLDKFCYQKFVQNGNTNDKKTIMIKH